MGLCLGLAQAGSELVTNGNFSSGSTGWLVASDCPYATVTYSKSFKVQLVLYFYDPGTNNELQDGGGSPRGAPLTPNSCQVSQVITTSIGSTYQVNILYGAVGYTGLVGYSIGMFRVGESACPLYMNNTANGTCSYTFVATSTSTVLQGITDWSSFIKIGGVTVTATLYSISVQEISAPNPEVGPPAGTELVTNGNFSSGTSGWGLSGDCKWGSTTTPSNTSFLYSNDRCFLYNYADSFVIIDQTNSLIPTMQSNCQLLQSVPTKIGSRYDFSITYLVKMPFSSQIAPRSMGLFRVGSHACILYGDTTSTTAYRTCSLSFTATQSSTLLQGVTDTALAAILGATTRKISIARISLVETDLPDAPASFLSSPSAPSTTNLIVNPNFASSSTGWTTSADCIWTSNTFANQFSYRQTREYYNPDTDIQAAGTYSRTSDNNYFPYIPLNCEVSQYVSTVVGATYSFTLTYSIATIAPVRNNYSGGVFRVGPTSCVLVITGTTQTCTVVFVASSNATLLQGVTDVPQLMSGGMDTWPSTGSNLTVIATSLTEIAPPPFNPPYDPPYDPPFDPPVNPPVDPPAAPPSDWKIIYGNLSGVFIVDTPTEVHGDVQLASLGISEGFPRLAVTGCFSTDSVSLTLSQAQIDQILSSSSSRSQQLVSAGTACPGAIVGSVPTNLEKSGSSGCKRITGQAQQDSSGSLSVLFRVSSTPCKVWWIVLISVVGGILILIVAFILLYRLNKQFQLKVSPYTARSSTVS